MKVKCFTDINYLKSSLQTYRVPTNIIHTLNKETEGQVCVLPKVTWLKVENPGFECRQSAFRVCMLAKPQ